MEQVESRIASDLVCRQPRRSPVAKADPSVDRVNSPEYPSASSAPRVKRLRASPEPQRRHLPSTTLIGEAGANLILSRLQSWGIAAQPAMAGLPYDLIADVPGFDMLRIQVKTRSRPNGKRCIFTMQRGHQRSRAGTFPYAPGDFDLAAFVCLSLSAVFFYAGPVERISLGTPWLRLPGIDRESLDLAIKAIRRCRYNDKRAWLASMQSDPTPNSSVIDELDAGTPVQAELDLGIGD
ncbi:group I intron-associated PD-(D/E)XK endonuclease [Acidiphilium multivorum]|uniref:group I intron-associated PD-(D/E)XK endonuclease n=1 Tax=Acidiphilium multivorum TaxID=62140 RepID=UPI0039C9C4AD